MSSSSTIMTDTPEHVLGIEDVPFIPRHSLERVGKFEKIEFEQLQKLTGEFEKEVLQPQRTRADTTINVVYVVNTGSDEKATNMHESIKVKLEEMEESTGAIIKFLGTYRVNVLSLRKSQPVGEREGVQYANDRIWEIDSLVRELQMGNQNNPTTDHTIPDGLEDAINDADVYIFGSQEACPILDVKTPYEPNYLMYYFASATTFDISLDERFSMGKTAGLQAVKEAVMLAIERNSNKYAGHCTWTGGKVLEEKGCATSHSNWHKELGPKGTDRFTYPTEGYRELKLPAGLVKHINTLSDKTASQ
ncbi:hypothetical protein BO82DRAFT_359972 [Aspergillus uvarum CBS 121591]|uniref:Uncharacterized protein n=1 Tax=Aspergillus uvarum CBS 121591 TaxID=1448315 RepID=A0A319BSS2_9EURO|nr:hypothetical protein BO82DRAFT_359972 [Aspergillus uvarum CBS 121591]PYH75521.1 hypothetical protein BO82DRAFT_359972 [Aspergillus uvarum CBS 121591]